MSSTSQEKVEEEVVTGSAVSNQPTPIHELSSMSTQKKLVVTASGKEEHTNGHSSDTSRKRNGDHLDVPSATRTPSSDSSLKSPKLGPSATSALGSVQAALQDSAPGTPKSHWRFYGCSQLVKDYEMLDKLGEGTFGEVHKARQKSTGALVALKRIFLHNEKEGFPLTALREIRILKSLDHKNILPLIDMAVQRGDRALRKKGSVSMVSPYMDHDMAGLLGNPNVRLQLPHIKCYMKQLLEGINYLHQQNYLHRDIKTANILIDNQGNLQIADFGLARYYDEEPPKPGQGAGVANRSYTGMVVTRWYRPPELILGEPRYTTAIDMWGIGCVLGEMFRRVPILQGNSDTDQGHKIFQLLGSPNNENMPGWDKLPGATITYGPYKRTLEGVFSDLDQSTQSLLSGLLTLNPQKRLTALGALDHSFFFTEPRPCAPEELPQYEASHELDARKSNKDRKQNPPLPPHQPEEERDRRWRRNDSDGEYSSLRYPARRRNNQPNFHHTNQLITDRLPALPPKPNLPVPPVSSRSASFGPSDEPHSRAPPYRSNTGNLTPPYLRNNRSRDNRHSRPYNHNPQPPYLRKSNAPPDGLDYDSPSPGPGKKY